MLQPLRTLLARVIDYAGLFPPASLAMPDAVRNYASYLKQPDRAFLGRFICPAARLGELAQAMERQFHAVRRGDWSLSLLATGGRDGAEFLSALKQDLQHVQASQMKYPQVVQGDVFEARLPAFGGPGSGSSPLSPVFGGEGSGVRGLLDSVADAAPEATFFYEAPLPADSSPAQLQMLDRVTTALAEFNRSRGGEGRAYFKLRCGGVKPEAFPASEIVAAAIVACRDRGLRLKFTAGLHHPFRHFNDGVQAKMHGFLNVLVAAVLAHARKMPVSALVPILEDEDPKHFWVDEVGLGYGNGSNYGASMAEIERARAWLPGFGSCSFDEPRDDLRTAGLM
jgi:hypothetical protein